VAFVAYHFHWSRDEILGLPHRERHGWVKEISKINKKINDTVGVEAAPAEAKTQWTGPNFRTTPEGGFQWVNPDLI
jgi:hypothetical protein